MRRKTANASSLRPKKYFWSAAQAPHLKMSPSERASALGRSIGDFPRGKSYWRPPTAPASCHSRKQVAHEMASLTRPTLCAPIWKTLSCTRLSIAVSQRRLQRFYRPARRAATRRPRRASVCLVVLKTQGSSDLISASTIWCGLRQRLRSPSKGTASQNRVSPTWSACSSMVSASVDALPDYQENRYFRAQPSRLLLHSARPLHGDEFNESNVGNGSRAADRRVVPGLGLIR
ncbi:hypothetical protein SAMN05445871_2324 [Paraburkholderia caballeronis]|uniref:Uncharacterized protein n=1 Tax=Paraburkholderia caballeronis TaxID=416943 RepID=A0A1H7W7A4_9BURK|nr:hypothetical protein C7403_1354 [Paraburkholderia caballeronis]PXW92324.1 hypothetical protein C7407_1374 [Paraburkholderia caballeronis]RAJ86573.1 hypothetical protein C7409_1374 [Paraburkholderia caballeronis]SEC49951.1 hypothetical protein SAMN05445871_2324 [Paraburkholderia caballeronis]SEM16935.1 hypothetical protein SAMN05192542_1329 [Paraburkholderia caballeronis]